MLQTFNEYRHVAGDRDQHELATVAARNLIASSGWERDRSYNVGCRRRPNRRFLRSRCCRHVRQSAPLEHHRVVSQTIAGPEPQAQIIVYEIEVAVVVRIVVWKTIGGGGVGNRSSATVPDAFGNALTVLTVLSSGPESVADVTGLVVSS